MWKAWPSEIAAAVIAAAPEEKARLISLCEPESKCLKGEYTGDCSVDRDTRSVDCGSCRPRTAFKRGCKSYTITLIGTKAPGLAI